MSNEKKGVPKYAFPKSVAPGVELPIWGNRVCEKNMKATHLTRDQTNYIGARQMIDKELRLLHGRCQEKS